MQPDLYLLLIFYKYLKKESFLKTDLLFLQLYSLIISYDTVALKLNLR